MHKKPVRGHKKAVGNARIKGNGVKKVSFSANYRGFNTKHTAPRAAILTNGVFSTMNALYRHNNRFLRAFSMLNLTKKWKVFYD